MEAAVIDRMFNFQDIISHKSNVPNDSNNNFESVMKETSKRLENKDGEKNQEVQKRPSGKKDNKIKDDSDVKENKIVKDDSNKEDIKIKEDNTEGIYKDMVVGENVLPKTDNLNKEDVINNVENNNLEVGLKGQDADNNPEVISITKLSEISKIDEQISENLTDEAVGDKGEKENKEESLTDAFFHHRYEEKEDDEIKENLEVKDTKSKKTKDDEIEGLKSEENVFEVGPQLVETENMTLNYETGSQNRGEQGNKEDSKLEVINLKKNKTKSDVELKESLSYTDVKTEVKSKFEDIRSQVLSNNQNVENPEDVIDQITEKAKAFITDDKSEVVIKLKPDHLGKVSLKISIENGNISAKFLAESEKVREMLESNFNNLKDSLNKQGLNVQNLSVSIGNSNKERSLEQEVSILSRRINARRVASLGINNEDDIYEDVEMSGMIRDNYYWPNSTVSFSA